MFPKMDPKQMAQLMRQFGIKNEEIKTSRVVIETAAGKKLILDSPTVLAIDMQGQKMFQVSGNVREVAAKGEGAEEVDEHTYDKELEGIGGEEEVKKLAEQDIALIAEQAKVSKEDARIALEKARGDIAEAILSASKKSAYMEEVGEQKELLHIIESSKSRELKEKAPLLYESEAREQLKGVHALHQLGRNQLQKMAKDERKDVSQQLRARLQRICALADEGEETSEKLELKSKASEILSWMG